MHAAIEPRAGGLTAAAGRDAVRWIDGLRSFRSDEWRTRPRAVCAAVCAGEVAAALGERPSDRLYAWAADLLHDTDLLALLDAPLAQTVTAGLACTRRGAGVPVLDDVVGSALALFADDPVADVATSEARLIAHAAGLAAEPTLPEPPAPPRLPADDDDVAWFAAGQSAATGFGTLEPTAASLEQTDLVSGLAGHYLRAYDLPLGTALVRALVHGGATESVGARDCLEFLLLQQRPEGSFGFFGPEAVDLPLGIDVALDLQLPVTLICAITLAEAAEAHWRFVDGQRP